MLSVYTMNGFIPIETRQNYYCLMNYDGFHQLSFDVSVSDPINKYLINEAIIQNEDNRFLIKDINRRTKNVTVTCELDMDEWKEIVFFDTANDVRFQTKLLGDILNVIKPNGWDVLNTGIRTMKRTPELKDCTSYDVLVSLENTFNVVFDINVIKKEIHVIDPESFEYDGLYATSELNMKGVTWQGSSSEFCTKLFAYGKTDDNGNTINIASINGGKEYIEDHTYTDKTITLVWRDERYTDPQSLYDDARKKLDVLCVPKMSYDISIYDLSQMNKEYDFLQFGLYKMVETMVNDDMSIQQRVVTYKKYYDKPDKNVITLSNEQQKLTSKVSNMLGGSVNETISGSFLEQAQKESLAILNAFATKGHRYETDSETYWLDKEPKEAAKYVMRINLGGIAFSQNGWAGPYVSAWTIDGKFNADFISTGTLQAIRINAAEIVGGSINIGDGSFIVDSSGHLKCSDANITGTVNATSGTFTGLIKGADVEGGNISGAKLISETTSKKVEIFDGLIKFTNKENGYTSKMYPEISAYINYDDPTYNDDAVVSRCNIETDASITTKEQIDVQGNIYGKRDAHISGNCYAKGYKTISDIRKKKDIEDVDISKLIDIVSVKKFMYLDSSKSSVGVIAQDYVGTPFEDIVLSKDNMGYYTVDYNAFLMSLIQKVKIQQTQIENLISLLKSKGVLE